MFCGSQNSKRFCASKNYVLIRSCRQYTVNTKAEVRFHVQTAEWIPEEVKKEIILKVRKEKMPLRHSEMSHLHPKVINCEPTVFLHKHIYLLISSRRKYVY